MDAASRALEGRRRMLNFEDVSECGVRRRGTDDYTVHSRFNSENRYVRAKSDYV